MGTPDFKTVIGRGDFSARLIDADSGRWEIFDTCGDFITYVWVSVDYITEDVIFALETMWKNGYICGKIDGQNQLFAEEQNARRTDR